MKKTILGLMLMYFFTPTIIYPETWVCSADFGRGSQVWHIAFGFSRQQEQNSATDRFLVKNTYDGDSSGEVYQVIKETKNKIVLERYMSRKKTILNKHPNQPNFSFESYRSGKCVVLDK